jgi:hypothetical protein
MAGYRGRFERLIEEIKSHPLLRVDRAEVRSPASDAEIEQATRAAGGALPSGVETLYRELNGMTLEWSLREDVEFESDEPPAGSINLLPLIRDRGESIFGSWKGVVWFDENDRFRRVVPFDFFTPEAGSVFYPVGGEMIVHDHYFGETLSSTGRGFAEYVELLFKARGYLYWPSSLCEDQQGSANVQDFRVNLPKLFGESDEAFHPLRR